MPVGVVASRPDAASSHGEDNYRCYSEREGDDDPACEWMGCVSVCHATSLPHFPECIFPAPETGGGEATGDGAVPWA
jgi:hypothetical protein